MLVAAYPYRSTASCAVIPDSASRSMVFPNPSSASVTYLLLLLGRIGVVHESVVPRSACDCPIVGTYLGTLLVPYALTLVAALAYVAVVTDPVTTAKLSKKSSTSPPDTSHTLDSVTWPLPKCWPNDVSSSNSRFSVGIIAMICPPTIVRCSVRVANSMVDDVLGAVSVTLYVEK